MLDRWVHLQRMQLALAAIGIPRPSGPLGQRLVSVIQ
jgi:hypothetical protein